MKNQIEPGDLFEINTSKGKGYIHYIGQDHDPDFGEFVRVLPGIFAETPVDLDSLVIKKERKIYYSFSM